MIPDIEQMTTNELDRLLITTASRIKALSHGRITRKTIAMALGIYHDPVQTRALFSKLKHVTCLQRAGSGYKILVNIVPPGSDEIAAVINSDPVMKSMNDSFDEALKMTPQRELELHYSDSSPYPCQYCLFFDDGWCNEHEEKRAANSRPCDEFEIDLDKMGVGPRSWYPTKLGRKKRKVEKK
jgi:hypothetical protein